MSHHAGPAAETETETEKKTERKTLSTAGTFNIPSAPLLLEAITPRMAGERMNSERYVCCAVLTFLILHSLYADENVL